MASAWGPAFGQAWGDAWGVLADDTHDGYWDVSRAERASEERNVERRRNETRLRELIETAFKAVEPVPGPAPAPAPDVAAATPAPEPRPSRKALAKSLKVALDVEGMQVSLRRITALVGQYEDYIAAQRREAALRRAEEEAVIMLLLAA